MSNTSNPKRAQIFKTGRDLFWKYGFKRVTIEEICKEASVSKMTYYKFFPNKIELVKTIMDDILRVSMDKYKNIMASDIPYPEKVVALIHLKKDQIEHMSSEYFKSFQQTYDS